MRISGDLDIVVTRENLPLLQRRLRDADGARLVNVLQHESTCYYFVLAISNGAGWRYLPVDAAADYRRDARIWFRAPELLTGARRGKGFSIAAPEVEFGYLLLKKILKEELPAHGAERLSELARELGAEAEGIAVRLLGKEVGRRIVTSLRAGNWRPDRQELARLKRLARRRRLQEDPFNAVRYWLPELGRIWRRWCHPTGLWVAVLGADGAGKSTVLGEIERGLTGAFRRSRTLHLLPGVLRRTGAEGPVTDPHGTPPRSALVSLAKLLLYGLDCATGYLIKIRPAAVRSTLVLFDRYYHDLLVDPRRYRYGGPMWLARLVGRLLPKPDLFILLDLPAEVAHARKPEVELEEARRLRQRYLELARELGAHVVDASRPLEEVVRECEEIVLTFMEERTRRRLRRLFPEAFGAER